MLIKANTLIATYLYGQIKNCPCRFVWKLVLNGRVHGTVKQVFSGPHVWDKNV